MVTKVLKFGGASLASIGHFERVADIVAGEKCDELVVVVSAMGDMTDHLFGLAKAIHDDPPKREQDMLVSVGERISMALLAMALDKRGVKAISLTGSQSGVITCTRHGEADIVEVRAGRVRRHLEEGNVVIVAGFQGMSEQREITTLGRGGSDTTAVALGAALEAECVTFYKDVGGVYSCDPKRDADARLLKRLSYGEALKVCEEGGVIHPRAIRLAEKHGIPLKVASFEEGLLGTEIV